MKMQHQAHTALQENNSDLRLPALQKFLPFFLILICTIMPAIKPTMLRYYRKLTLCFLD